MEKHATILHCGWGAGLNFSAISLNRSHPPISSSSNSFRVNHSNLSCFPFSSLSSTHLSLHPSNPPSVNPSIYSVSSSTFIALPAEVVKDGDCVRTVFCLVSGRCKNIRGRGANLELMLKLSGYPLCPSAWIPLRPFSDIDVTWSYNVAVFLCRQTERRMRK